MSSTFIPRTLKRPALCFMLCAGIGLQPGGGVANAVYIEDKLGNLGS